MYLKHVKFNLVLVTNLFIMLESHVRFYLNKRILLVLTIF